MSGEIPVSGVLFDLDGVLVNSIPAHGEAWVWIMRTLGIEVDPVVAPLTEGMHSRRIARLIFAAAGYEPGLSLDDESLDRLINRKREYYRGIVGDLRLSGEMIGMLEAVRSRVAGIALVTSSSKTNLDHVVVPSAQKLFDVVLWADSVLNNKPHPEPYLKAAVALGLPPERCLVVENAPLGIRSARAAGEWCVAISSTMPAEKLGEAHAVLDSALELGRGEVWRELMATFTALGKPGDIEPGDFPIEPIRAHLVPVKGSTGTETDTESINGR